MPIRLFFTYWVPVILYAGTITMVSGMSTPHTYFPLWAGEINDKVLHALEYAILAILCYRALRHASGPGLADYAAVLAIVGAILFGVSDELHQYFVPLRESDPWDLVANGAGSLMGVTGWQIISPRLRLFQTP
ncbi:MAG: VanZ family protein [Nitrospirota bacterium]|nr:MAG: VanZ family protein [Nitrospirota bacterium]